MNQVPVQSLQEILPGLKLQEVDTSTGYTTLQHDQEADPDLAGSRVGQGLQQPLRVRLLHLQLGRDLLAARRATNYSLLGITKEQADECGIGGRVRRLRPELTATCRIVDDKMNECVAEAGRRSQRLLRRQMDKTLMEDVVPWVPWVVGEQLDDQ